MRFRARELERMLNDVGEACELIELLDPKKRDCGPIDEDHRPHIEPAALHAEALERLRRVRKHLQRHFHLGT